MSLVLRVIISSSYILMTFYFSSICFSNVILKSYIVADILSSFLLACGFYDNFSYN